MTTAEQFFTYQSGSGEKKKLKFPKGKVELRHYTTSGLYMWDNEETGKDKHSQQVELRMNVWDKDKPEDESVAMHFIRDATEKMSEEEIYVGFEHIKTKCAFLIFDSEKDKKEHKMESLISHHDKKSYLSFLDKDTEEKDVTIELKHKIGDFLKMDSIHEKDSLVKLHHHKEAGFKVRNQGDRVIIDIYHPKNAKIEIDGEGAIFITSENQKVTVEAPDIYLNGHTTVNGDLDVAGTIHSDTTITAPGGNWHNG